jgi:hypothetical protein
MSVKVRTEDNTYAYSSGASWYIDKETLILTVFDPRGEGIATFRKWESVEK